jgi:hypothetical protein
MASSAGKEIAVRAPESAREVGRRSLVRVMSILLLAGLTGCFSSEPYVVPMTDSEKNLTNIVVAYTDALEELHRPPKNAEELKPFLKKYGDPDQLLTSPNDHEPYVVIWGVNPTRGGPTEYQQMWPVLAYERKGSGGKRAIVDIRGHPMLVPEEDMSKLTFAGGHKPPLN